MIKTINECYDCPIPCINCGRKHMEVRICNYCQDSGADYQIDGEDICEACLQEKIIDDLKDILNIVELGYDITDTAELLGYDIRRA